MSTHAASSSLQSTSSATFLEDVTSGLSRGVNRKRLSCQFLYDERGCELFEQICTLTEYYPTRTELRIMDRDVEMMAQVCGESCMLIELGSGSSTKTKLLLGALSEPAMYVPVDIAPEYLWTSSHMLAERFPDLSVRPLCADFTEPFDVPSLDAPHRRVVYFPGSTIGNFHRDEAVRLVSHMRRIGGEDGGILIGIDLKKDVDVLEAAYNDGQGVTAEFNLNLLQRMQRELDAEVPIHEFEHVAQYNTDLDRIEMYLRSTTRQTIRIGQQEYPLQAGECIHTEYSYKYSLCDVQKMAQAAECQLTHIWLDEQNWFGVFFLECAPW